MGLPYALQLADFLKVLADVLYVLGVVGMIVTAISFTIKLIVWLRKRRRNQPV